MCTGEHGSQGLRRVKGNFMEIASNKIRPTGEYYTALYCNAHYCTLLYNTAEYCTAHYTIALKSEAIMQGFVLKIVWMGLWPPPYKTTEQGKEGRYIREGLITNPHRLNLLTSF